MLGSDENGTLEVFKSPRENNCHDNPLHPIDDKQFKSTELNKPINIPYDVNPIGCK
jgi:hypothetical protein